MPLSHPERSERRAQIAEYANQQGIPKAAKRFKVSQVTVRSSLSENGLTPSKSERSELKKQIAEYASIHGVHKSAKRFAVSETTVRSSLYQNGLARAESIPMSVSSFVILRMLLDGIQGSEVASQVKVSRQRVSQIKKDAEKAGFKFS